MMARSTSAAWKRGALFIALTQKPNCEQIHAQLVIMFSIHVTAGHTTNFIVCGRGASSLVHYWYHPDSYDRCIPAEVAPEVIEPDKRIRGDPISCPSLCHFTCQSKVFSFASYLQASASPWQRAPCRLLSMCTKMQGHGR